MDIQDKPVEQSFVKETPPATNGFSGGPAAFAGGVSSVSAALAPSREPTLLEIIEAKALAETESEVPPENPKKTRVRQRYR